MRVAHAPGMPGTFSPPQRVDLDLHHGTCVTHVPCCMPMSINIGFFWSWWQGKRSRHSRRMRNPQFYASGKRPMVIVRIVKVWKYNRSNALRIISLNRQFVNDSLNKSGRKILLEITHFGIKVGSLKLHLHISFYILTAISWWHKYILTFVTVWFAGIPRTTPWIPSSLRRPMRELRPHVNTSCECHWLSVLTLYEQRLLVIPAWISNHIPSKVWDEITCSFPNFNVASLGTDKQLHTTLIMGIC